MSSVRLLEFGKDVRGFTLPEVLTTIVIMGILVGIAVPTWQSVVEGRWVDSATNQLASDLRLAHSKATNQLKPYQVVLTDGGSSYQIGPQGGLFQTRDFCGDDGCDSSDPKVDTSLTTIEFKPDGSATGPTDVANEIVVSKTANPATDPKHSISINPVTSRVKVD